MTERDDLRAARENKLDELIGLGLPYFPNRFGPTRSASEIVEGYGALEGGQVRVAGRVMRVRMMGKAAFAHIQDASGQIQLYVKLDILGADRFQYFKLLDLGDIIGVEGTVFKTRTGEVSVEVRDLVLLAKSYLPLPEKYHGLSDVETRYRQRYLDLISNEETRRLFAIRAAVLRSVRRLLDARGFVEVETPILQPLYGGAAATPFVSHYEALDMTVYLRIATELYLKRLIVGGMERVYEIGKDFRNEGLSWKHLPEFTMVELYQAYADYNDIMDLTEELFCTAAQEALGRVCVRFGEHEINLAPPWRRETIRDAISSRTGIDIERCGDAADLILRMTVKLLPEIRIAQLLAVLLFVQELIRRELEKCPDRNQGVAHVIAQARSDDSEGEDTVGNHHSMQRRKFFLEQQIAVLLYHEKFESALERRFELRDIPRLGRILVNGT